MFNKNSLKSNAIKATTLGISNQIIAFGLAFVYRIIFLKVLTAEYLGLNGLFSNILLILSLAELGLGSAIIFRLYKAIADNDIHEVAGLLNFYKKVYRVIMIVIFVIGMSLMPFIKYFIKADSPIPEDINIYWIYFLYLMQTVTSYFFAYRQGLLSADQRSYQLTMFSIIGSVLRYSAQILVLLLLKNFTLTLIVAIIINLSVNLVIAYIIKRKYPEIFDMKDHISPEKKKIILKDTYALLCHRIGGTVLNGTDMLLITFFIGLTIGGIYSNYTVIIVSVMGLVNQMLTSFNGSIGNLNVVSENDYKFDIYHNLTYLNMWVAMFCSISLFVLFNPFITLWLGKDMLLSQWTVGIIAVNFFVQSARSINNSFIAATGLFTRDKYRPFIEAGLNLVLSIGFVTLFSNEKLFINVYNYLGEYGQENLYLIGIFLGTFMSVFFVAIWREVYLLHKYLFNKKSIKYWIKYITISVLTISFGWLTYFLCNLLDEKLFFVKVIIVAIVPNVLFVATTFWTKEFKYFKNLIIYFVSKLIKKKPDNSSQGKE